VSFLHPEFIFWMTPFVGILFYFWFTQKRHNEHHFSLEALEKLRVNGSTLGDDGRNGFFLGASLLIILALAQPAVQHERIVDAPETILIAMDISNHSLVEFEAMKKRAMALIDEIEGAVELVGYDSKVYRIAPASEDKNTLKELIANLSPQIMNSSISDEKLLRNVCKTSNIIVVSGNKTIDRGIVEKLRKPKEHWVYLPLFYFPLALAMLFIAIALSSMSKRQSVSMTMVTMIFMGVSDGRAGVMDFRLLEDAKRAYSHGQYEQSTRLFGEYRLLHDSPQARYNYANALFKAGHFEKARYWYERVDTNDSRLKEWVRINKGQLPVKKREKAEKKSEITIKKENKKGQNLIEIGNGTPLFIY
jgi:hypothetical protein